jgi:hypothetical protein
VLRRRISLQTPYVVGAGLAVSGFVVAGALLAVTLPYHQWDSFGFGDWSRAIAQHGTIDPFSAGAQSAARPVFYELQGLLWSVTGISFAAGRLLSLAFAVLFVGSVGWLQRGLTRDPLEVALAVACALAIPVFSAQSLSGQTDVPAAAMVALVAALALRSSRGAVGQGALVAAAVAAVLTKQTVLIALVPFAAVLFAARLRAAGAVLAAGLGLGLAYDLEMAHRFHTDLSTFLREGSGGIWAQLADQTRHDAVLRADVLGAGLRLPLIFGLVYAIVRLARVPHRLAVGLGLAVGLVWSIAGPLAAGVPNGAFAHPEDGFTLVGFAVILGASSLLPADAAPRPRTLAFALALGVPPLGVWVAAGTYTDRLAAGAWPGLAVLIACVIAAGIRGLARGGVLMALAPAAVIAMAVWMSLASLDGLHGSMWTEYRSLGWSGLGDKARTMHVVLPALQSTLATAESQLAGGRLVTGDPMIPWFLPGVVDTKTPATCRDVVGYRVFVLLTGDESIAEARDAGRLATPEQWAQCSSPKLQQLSDGSNGYAVFAVPARQ